MNESFPAFVGLFVLVTYAVALLGLGMVLYIGYLSIRALRKYLRS